MHINPYYRGETECLKLSVRYLCLILQNPSKLRGTPKGTSKLQLETLVVFVQECECVCVCACVCVCVFVYLLCWSFLKMRRSVSVWTSRKWNGIIKGGKDENIKDARQVETQITLNVLYIQFINLRSEVFFLLRRSF